MLQTKMHFSSLTKIASSLIDKLSSLIVTLPGVATSLFFNVILFAGLVVAMNVQVLAESVLPALVYPVMSPRVSGKFGKRHHPIYKVSRHHKGIDLAAPYGTPIRAVRDGVVVFSDAYAGYGNLVVIKHNNGFTSHYGHCKSISTKIGNKVSAGEIIATVGSTGKSTGPHLHFELRLKGEALDPEEYVPGLTARPEG